VFEHLDIYDSGERVVVGLADVALRAASWPFRVGRSAGVPGVPQRVLVLRLERIGDLVMIVDALAALRASLPSAHIDLVVGSWNEPLARAMAVADTVEALDPPWLARDGQGANWPAIIARAREWRQPLYDLAVNFEPDIRTNLLLGMSGARRRVGWYTGGGGACLTQAAAYDPRIHTRDNAMRLVQVACADWQAVGRDSSDAGRGFSPGVHARLAVPDSARERAREWLGPNGGRRLIALHASGGRAIKQWHLDRFAAVATFLGREYDATVVLTGTDADAPLVQSVRLAIAPDVTVIDACGDLDLLTLAAVLERCALFVTGDTGPMHLAAAVDTPTVAIFGPSDPARYRPLTDRHRVVRIDLPCSPCNRIRLPPERCRGHVPDCLDGISVEQVLAAARGLLGPASDTRTL
jgi:ADP-heptose:LPS heptosyltransferase